MNLMMVEVEIGLIKLQFPFQSGIALSEIATTQSLFACGCARIFGSNPWLMLRVDDASTPRENAIRGWRR